MEKFCEQEKNQSIEKDLIAINCTEKQSIFEAEQKAIKEAELVLERFKMMQKALRLN